MFFNEWLGLGLVLINFFLVIAMYRFFGKTGLFVWIALATMLANIQVTKTIEIFGLTATLGNALYGSAFLVTDILNEKYGKKEARKAVWLGFSVLIIMNIVMQIALVFHASPEDWAHEHLAALFGIIPRIALGSMIAYFISQHADVIIFSYFKKLFPSDRAFWIRNNVSTGVSQLLDTLIFTSIAFIGVFPFDVWIQIFITTYLLKFIVAILDTPFGYWAKRITPSDER